MLRPHIRLIPPPNGCDDMAEPIRIALALAAGLLLGSVLPCELFAKRCGVDIRAVGDGNPGAYNALLGMGAARGVVTAAYDLSVGVVVVLLARWLEVPDVGAYAAGLLTIVGHRFPVYKAFRGGGQAMAAAAGLVVYGVSLGIADAWLSWLDLGILVAIGAATLAITRTPKDIAIVLMPVLAFVVLTSGAPWEYAAFVTLAAGHIWVTQVVLAVRAHAPAPASERNIEDSSGE